MRANITMFWLLAGFFLLASTIYTTWSLIDTGRVEWAGSVALLLSSVLGAFIAFYVARVRKAQGAELPEDRPDADIDDGDPELGFFSPWSWWPLILGGSAALGFLGLAVGFWIIYIAAGLFLVAIAGWVYEYYRGYFAR
ncbi:cytochrome c oxidase subunit 4 [Rathayibacter toxicus]|uniref:Cytochrome c oxidase polypeptide 4 n=1 Tax=Rathayibacter toxicus TaxID=145458 RepID=A0A0C5BH18_9MICO|nr:cytochrome c oxidase subunit 4 [Rathayibacter toxicus]AJM77490.1 cytochrome c oxidase subunit IV [Rathayibacter toxicus]ALS56599.1 cytochrome c oxidase subunit IV [Rathayibacter toxicus]KKM44691.1 cytochrome c oxidase subunit IV [Rathayibacter toxicus]PPG21572.1 cytochrome c oxidase subunit 4 [Rathayibacter toxicus]PPG46536.1 cytochrome c oxidase subunit 4 [Rathayibacter toxicus]